MENEFGTIGVAVVSTIVLAFGLWVIKKIGDI